MNSPSNASTLPPLYNGWMEDLLQATIPNETEASCFDCAMCSSKQIQRTEQDHIFNSKTKCCTYIPKIPNFLVGRILSDESPDAVKGRTAFEAYFREGAVVRPQGVSAHHDFSLLYRQDASLFGRNEALRCPYYLHEEGGLCGIWRHRNSTCSTWFCKHVRGDKGRLFWKSVDDLLATVQQGLTHWCIQGLQAGEKEFRECFPVSFEENSRMRFQQQMYFYKSSLAVKMQDPVTFRRLFEWSWGRWLDRQVEFFQECAKMVNPLRWHDLINILGPEIAELGNQTRDRFNAMISNHIPETLTRGIFKKIELNESTVRIWGYAVYDPIDLPKSILEMLPYFNGVSTAVALQRIETESGIRLAPELLRKLVDFGILKTTETRSH